MKKAVVLTLIILLLLVFAPLIVKGLGVESALAGDTGTSLLIDAYPSLFLPIVKTAGSRVNSAPTMPALP